ncbi:hypothetical protein JTB14_012307 [Gonioctena quinquepunctata]|nr:hypothetical protein JTB14_012307 [Gonioctena quinquepunctata]
MSSLFELLLVSFLITVTCYPFQISGRSLKVSPGELPSFEKLPVNYIHEKTWKVDPEDKPHPRIARATRRRLYYTDGSGGYVIINNDLPSSVNYHNSYDRFPTVA